MNVRLAMVLLGVLGFGVSAALGQVQVQPDANNVVSSRLEGTWVPHEELTKHLEGRAPGPVTFRSDPKIAAKIPARYEKFLKGRQVYMAGEVTFGGKTHPFILVEHRGNPHVVWFRERGGDPLGDAESFNVMLAVAKQQQNDLLFIGGDFNNQPFAAYHRAKDKK